MADVGHGMLDDARWLPFTCCAEDYDLGAPVGTFQPLRCTTTPDGIA